MIVTSLSVYCYLKEKAKGGDTFVLTTETMHRELGISKRGAVYALRAMRECGAIEVSVDKSYRNNKRLVRLMPNFSESDLPKGIRQKLKRTNSELERTKKMERTKLNGTFSELERTNKLGCSKLDRTNSEMKRTFFGDEAHKKVETHISKDGAHTLKVEAHTLKEITLSDISCGEISYKNQEVALEREYLLDALKVADERAGTEFSMHACTRDIYIYINNINNKLYKEIWISLCKGDARGKTFSLSDAHNLKAPSSALPVKRPRKTAISYPTSPDEVIPLIADWKAAHKDMPQAALVNTQLEAESFYFYYTERGWKDNKGNPVKNVKARVNTWCANSLRYGSCKSPTSMPMTAERIAAMKDSLQHYLCGQGATKPTPNEQPYCEEDEINLTPVLAGDRGDRDGMGFGDPSNLPDGFEEAARAFSEDNPWIKTLQQQ